MFEIWELWDGDKTYRMITIWRITIKLWETK